MKNIFTTLLIFIAFSTLAQKVEREVLSASGSDFKNSTMIYSQTVGELGIISFSSSSIIVSEGFQKSNLAEATTVEETNTGFKVNAYPNPVNSQLHLDFTSDKPVDVKLQLLDISGRLLPIESNSIQFDGTFQKTLDVSTLPSGSYMIIVNVDNTENGSLKFIKQ